MSAPRRPNQAMREDRAEPGPLAALSRWVEGLARIKSGGVRDDGFRRALLIVAALTLVRVIVLVVSPLQFYPDEAQYWWWAQTPDWGYFSKPPMIAWVIWLTTHLFGQSEWAARLASPLLHGATALLVYGIGRRCFDERTGFWSAVAYATLPGVSYSSGLISTDVPLLFFWAAGLYAFLRAMARPGWTWAIVCGGALGLGFETKYAMAYFFLCAGLAAFASTDARRLVLSLRGLVIVALALLLLMPNAAWNAAHGFPTVAHTGHNADWSHARYNAVSVLGFLGGQFGVFGPLMMAGLILALWRLKTGKARLLACFSLPVIALIAVQSFISEANANWAAVAYVAATPLAVAALLWLWRGRMLWASLAFDGLAMAVLWAILVSPAFADRIGQGNAFKRQEGWRELGAAVHRYGTDYPVIVAANRSVFAELLAYGGFGRERWRMWDKDTHDDDHFQMTMRLTPPAPHVLLLLTPDETGQVLPTFDSATRVATVVIPVGGHRTRTTLMFDAHGYRGPQPLR
ncbi:MAG TPA: glycosyltransferase family 39 protein [Rhizomicrobium sp.]|nr:glycosyltransferase family 39 protein [Rhizomicrobium sp.]